MNRNTAFIALGSNVGNKFDHLQEAVDILNQNSRIKIIELSTVYVALPYGNKEQDNFLNAVVKIRTSLNADDLFSHLKSVERIIGRIPRNKWGPREIDLDLLFFNDLVLQSEVMTIPHPGIPERDFVLTPLCEIDPQFIHPALKKKIADICNDEKNQYIIDKYPASLQNNVGGV